MKILVTILLFFMFVNSAVYAHGECCLSRSLTEATTSDISLAGNLGLSLQYEYSNMKTIRDGSNSVSHNTVLDRVTEEWPMMSSETRSFSIPTRMIMQKYSFLGAFRLTERFQFLVNIPYVINDMYMRKITRGAMGMDMRMDMKMDTVEGPGDMTLMGLYTLLADEPGNPTKKLTLGLGVKTPTGENDEVTESGSLVHAMMQPGTGSWDPLFLVNYMRSFSPLVLQANLLYHMTTEGDQGYEFGDKVSLDIIGRYRVASYVSPGLELNGLYAGEDDDHDGRYSRPDTSLLDNTDNTGITSLSVTPSVRVNVPGTGCSVDLKFQKPLYQHANGTQQVVDWRAIASVVWAF